MTGEAGDTGGIGETGGTEENEVTDATDVTGAPHRTRFALEYRDERRARIVESSVALEIDEIDDDRSRAIVSREGRTVEVHVEAADLVALRAAGNTWLSLADVAERTANATETVPF